MSGHLAWDAISGYTKGIVIVAFADALLVFIGLTILQVPLAPALSALVFIGAFIPVIGAPIATFFAAVVALAERGPVVALLVIGADGRSSAPSTATSCSRSSWARPSACTPWPSSSRSRPAASRWASWAP